MWDWFRRLIDIVVPAYPLETTTVIVTDTTRCAVTRLGSDIDLVLTMRGTVQDTGEIAEVKLTLSDPTALRELSSLLLNLAPRLEPPYFAESDIGELWDDEHEDITDDVRELWGDEAEAWLNAPNVTFGGQSPQQVIDAGKAYWVREILRQIKMGVYT